MADPSTLADLKAWVQAKLDANAHLIEVLSGERARFLEERSTRIDERFGAERLQTDASVTGLEKQLVASIAGQDRALGAALAAQERAASILETQSQEWRTAANEWRGAMTDRDRLLVSRDTYDTAMTAQSKQLSDLTNRLTLAEGKAQGAASSTGLLLAVAGVIATVVGGVVAVLALNG